MGVLHIQLRKKTIEIISMNWHIAVRRQNIFLIYTTTGTLVNQLPLKHLGTKSSAECSIADPDQWMCGSFKVCIRLDIHQAGILPKTSPHAVSFTILSWDADNPGNSDEKILCEAGTYAWLQANFPDITIPKLYGFGLASGWLGHAIPSQYVQIKYKVPITLRAGYILIEYIE
ncbi:hypothetical protein N7481_007364 [Penicillium waksmanii]|uniref:uncharacterized protein n=1 Tax=Penicillium waksmanii TaxID=69791 RepID=UPI002547A6CD|nr:uncharacterized protein N7481_007364 [Penicillium waksmanii]KAJ5980066.1 hypothetical protein N7481_007364 [Penicillium waksmanii]